jgi:hypothetical protein
VAWQEYRDRGRARRTGPGSGSGDPLPVIGRRVESQAWHYSPTYGRCFETACRCPNRPLNRAEQLAQRLSMWRPPAGVWLLVVVAALVLLLRG